MVAADCAGSDALVRATRRAMREELGVEVGLERAPMRFLTTLLELETLNVAFLFLIELSATAAQLRAVARDAIDAEDADRIEFVPAESESLEGLAQSGGGASNAPLHPASPLRLSVLARWLRERPRTS